MRYRFTPGARRALAAAAGCQSAGISDIQPASLLLGLLAVPECRAARMLADSGIDAKGVHDRWPDLGDSPQVPQQAPSATNGWAFSPDVVTSLESVRQRLAAWCDPLEFATEHLLLGLASAEHEAARWLASQGLDPSRLEAEISRLHGFDARPIDSEVLGPPIDVPEELKPPPVGTAVTRGVPLPANEISAPPRRRDLDGTSQFGVFRALDASYNRAREAVRVIEDYTRFVLDDRYLTCALKELRHALSAALERVPYASRIGCRETQADVGTQLSTPREGTRPDTQAVLAANFARLSESLRSLEEYGKVVDPAVAAEMEQLRYRSYTLERAVQTTRQSAATLSDARLYVLIDGRSSESEFEQLVRTLTAAGADVLQLRDKQLDDRTLLARGRRLSELAAGTQTRWIMNDRADLAALCGAAGVHVGQEELSVKDARAILGPGKLIGVSTHSIEQARQAVLDGADYLGVGPTFPSRTKQFAEFPGVELIRAVAAEIQLPWFAIGGISEQNLDDVLAAGATRVAVGSAVVETADAAGSVRSLKSRLATG